MSPIRPGERESVIHAVSSTIQQLIDESCVPREGVVGVGLPILVDRKPIIFGRRPIEVDE